MDREKMAEENLSPQEGASSDERAKIIEDLKSKYAPELVDQFLNTIHDDGHGFYLFEVRGHLVAMRKFDFSKVPSSEVRIDSAYLDDRDKVIEVIDRYFPMIEAFEKLNQLSRGVGYGMKIAQEAAIKDILR